VVMARESSSRACAGPPLPFPHSIARRRCAEESSGSCLIASPKRSSAIAQSASRIAWRPCRYAASASGLFDFGSGTSVMAIPRAADDASMAAAARGASSGR